MSESLKVICALLVTSISSFLLGSFVLRKLKLQPKYQLFCLPFGFFFFVALWQMLIYPIQFLHLEAKYLLTIYQGLQMFALAVGFLEIKQIRHIHWKFLLVSVVLLAASVAIFSKCNIFYYLVGNQEYGMTGIIDDFTYYVRTIAINAKPENLVGMVDVMNGNVAETSAIYAFTGILHFFSAQCMLWDINATYFTLWYGFVILRVVGFLMAYNLGSLIGKDNKWMKWFVTIVMILQLFTHTNIINGFEPVYLRGVPGSAAMLILSLILYYKTEEKGWLWVYVLFSFATMSCQSTQFFLSAILSVALMSYEAVVKKRVSIPFLTFTCFPTILYFLYMICEMYGADWAIVMIFIIVLALLNLIYLIFPKLFHHWIVYTLLIGVFGLIVSYPFVNEAGQGMIGDSLTYFKQYLSFQPLDNISVVSGKWDFINEVFVRLYLIVPFVSLFFWKKLNIEMKWITVFMLTIILLFYNPLSMPFVSKYISGSVFDRIENVVINQTFYFMIIQFFSEKKNVMIKVCLVSALSAIPVIVLNTMDYYHDYQKHESVLNAEYKMDQIIMKMSDEINQYSQDKNVKVLYPIELLNLCLYNEKIQNSSLMPTYNELKIKDWMYKYDKLSDRMKMQCYLYLPVDYFTNYFYEFENENVPDIVQLLRDTDADLVIFRKWESPEGENSMFYMYLSLTTKKIAEIGDYQLFEIIRG